MVIQLWSYNYDPEPTGIGPVSRVWAEAMRDLGHQVQVVAAHPHYPEPRWGTRLLPYRESRNGIPVLRLPLWAGRASASQRYRQELSFMLAQSAAVPALGRPEAMVSVSPCFPALLPAMINARVRHIPWVLWLQDILPDGAAATGIVREGAVLRAARTLERSAYRAARSIVVPSRSFAANLTAKGVPEEKIEIVHNPATRFPEAMAQRTFSGVPLKILSMGNIGHSQGLAPLVRAFEDAGGDLNARLTITGTGVAADEVRAECNERVQMPGLLSDSELERELVAADVALVSQRYDGAEFNIPSKIMTFMAYGLPIIAAVNPESEAARIVMEAGAGWVIDSSQPARLPELAQRLANTRGEIAQGGTRAYAYAQAEFTPTGMAARFDRLLSSLRFDPHTNRPTDPGTIRPTQPDGKEQ